MGFVLKNSQIIRSSRVRNKYFDIINRREITTSKYMSSLKKHNLDLQSLSRLSGTIILESIMTFAMVRRINICICQHSGYIRRNNELRFR
jgi:hypothetical protein